VIVPELASDFKYFEKEVFQRCCALGREVLKEALENWDIQLMEERDCNVYRHKGKCRTTIKTVMGEVEYRRVVYTYQNSDGKTVTVYLLDEAMGIEGSGLMSSLLSEKIALACCEGSYRNAARSVSEMTGQTISHTAAWGVVQNIGAGIDAQELEGAKAVQAQSGAGEIGAKLLFEEMDGIWLKLQGKSRKEHGPGKEMKLAIAYDGAKKEGKKHYELTNKVACANFEGAEAFHKRKEGVIAGTYNIDEIDMRFLNGDGAAWIKQSIIDETIHFQLDPYHRNQAIRTHVKNPDMRKQILKLLYDKDIDNLLIYIEALSNSVDNEEERENLATLWGYFDNNKEGLVPCHRRGLELPQPPEGIVYRRMGAMESNIFSILGNRMKGRRACWSINGGNNLARLLCLKATQRLPGTLQSLTTLTLPEKYAEEIITGLTPAKVGKSVGKGYNGFHKTIAPPTPNYKWLRGLGSLRPLSGLSK